MCGIVGYSGPKEPLPILIAGLSRLEYRGYDSAGIAVSDGSDITIEKKEGKLDVLKEHLGDKKIIIFCQYTNSINEQILAPGL